MTSTLLSKLDRIPPCLCRLMAKRPDGRLMTDKEISKQTGWTRYKVKKVGNAASFRDITVGDVDTILKAYGLSWSSQRRLLWLMQSAWRSGGLERMKHLRYHTGWQASMIRAHQKRIAKLLGGKP